MCPYNSADGSFREQALLEPFTSFHPLFVEGMSGYDTRDPVRVAASVVASLREHWKLHPPTKPVLLMLQGDPLTKRGISAITRLVASALAVPRGLIVLDHHIADYHSLNADRDGVVLETQYSKVADWLASYEPGALTRLEAGITAQIEYKNRERAKRFKPPMAGYFPTFAMLQEVSKGAFSALCGEMTLIHTSRELVASSVSSFCTVGLALELYSPHCVVSCDAD